MKGLLLYVKILPQLDPQLDPQPDPQLDPQLDFSAVVCPVEDCLALFGAAGKFTLVAVLFYLRDVAFYSFPPFYLPFVVGAPATHVVTAVPLGPAPRVFVVDPTFFSPFG